MNTLTNMTVRDIALEAPLTTRVFEKYKIDFCCGGRVPLAEACEKAGIEPSAIMSELEQVFAEHDTSSEAAAESKKQLELIDHIIQTHHAYSRSELTRLLPLAEKVWNRHGENHPELERVMNVVQEMANELFVHMRKEEAMLFPYIEQLSRAVERNTLPPTAPFGSVNNPVRMMMFEHDQAGEMLRELRSLTNDYVPPADSCPSYKGLYAGLEAHEKDLHQHIHLENNVLFPKAIADEELCFNRVTAAA